MPIDLSTYPPTTVLRVECRDRVLGHLHPGTEDTHWPHVVVRDDRDVTLVDHAGRRSDDDDYPDDVVRILGEMVMKDAT